MSEFISKVALVTGANRGIGLEVARQLALRGFATILGAWDGIRAFSVHPGRILATSLSPHMSEDEINAVAVADEHGRELTDTANFIKTAEQGAATNVRCATSRQLDSMGGVYCED